MTRQWSAPNRCEFPKNAVMRLECEQLTKLFPSRRLSMTQRRLVRSEVINQEQFAETVIGSVQSKLAENKTRDL